MRNTEILEYPGGGVSNNPQILPASQFITVTLGSLTKKHVFLFNNIPANFIFTFYCENRITRLNVLIVSSLKSLRAIIHHNDIANLDSDLPMSMYVN